MLRRNGVQCENKQPLMPVIHSYFAYHKYLI